MTLAKMKPMTNGDVRILNKRESPGPNQEEESSQTKKKKKIEEEEEEGALSVFTFNTERLPNKCDPFECRYFIRLQKVF